MYEQELEFDQRTSGFEQAEILVLPRRKTGIKWQILGFPVVPVGVLKQHN